jgi:hypothetical protein
MFRSSRIARLGSIRLRVTGKLFTTFFLPGQPPSCKCKCSGDYTTAMNAENKTTDRAEASRGSATHWLSSIASARCLCASAPGARRQTRCKIVQKGAIGSRRGRAKPMILSPHLSVCARDTAPSTRPNWKPLRSLRLLLFKDPCFPARAQVVPKRDKTRQITTKRDKSRHPACHRIRSGPILDRFRTDFPPLPCRRPATAIGYRLLLVHDWRCASGPARAEKRRQILPKPAKTRQNPPNRGFGFQLSAFPVSRFASQISGPRLSRNRQPSSSLRPAPASHGTVGRKMKIPQTLPFCAKTCQEMISLCSGMPHFPRRFKFGCSLVRSGAFCWPRT